MYTDQSISKHHTFKNQGRRYEIGELQTNFFVSYIDLGKRRFEMFQ